MNQQESVSVKKINENLLNSLFEKNPYQDFEIEKYQKDMQGWGSEHPIFNRMIETIRPKLIMEVGVWKGGSTLTMANSLRKNDIDCPIICIDTWLGGEEHFNSKLFTRKNGYPKLFYQFLANMLHEGIEDIVVPFPQTSHIAAEILRKKEIVADLVYIDASHEYGDVLEDLKRYWSLVSDNGCLIGDDYQWSWFGVGQAAREFCQTKQLKLYIWRTKYLIVKNGVKVPKECIEVPPSKNLYFNAQANDYIWK